MQKKILINLIIVSICGIILTSGGLYAIQTVMARNSAEKTFSLQLDSVEERMRQNELKIEELIQAAKEDYISRARALAMMIELDPGIIEDREKLNEVTVALNVDEVHIIDENGILWWGTQPQYYGMNFAETDQTRPFLAILDDPSLEIAQDPMPNGSSGLMRQYAGVSLRNAKGIAQIGMVPEHLEKALENNQICNVLCDVIIGNTGYVFALSADTGVISSHPNRSLIGTLLPERLNATGFMDIDGQQVMYGTRLSGAHVLVSVIPVSELYAQRTFYTVIFMGFMILVFGAFCAIVSAYIKVRVVNGISDAVRTLEAVSAGNLDVTADVRLSSEFEKLSDGINHMLSSIKNKIGEIRSMTDDIRRFGAIVAIADAGIIVKDTEGVVLEWNIGAETILGYKPEEIIGKTTKAYAPEDKHADIDEIEARLKKGEHIAHVEVVRKHRDGRLIDCSASYTPIFDENGTFTGSVSIFHDISDKKQIEQALHDAVLAAEQANSAKSSFLANMSHEIRTPLNGIIGFAELAGDGEDIPEKTKDYLEKIKVSGEGLLKIINDILDISKIEAGKMDLEKIPFSIHDVLDICKTLSSPRADEKGVILYFYTEPLIKKKLLGDPTKLRQILLNLLSNAIKFTNRGMVKLITAVEETSGKSVKIRFEVKDNGIGMAPEQIQRIFTPFTQADSSTTRKYGGTGLGLAITKSMVELMGGKLKAESTLGVGSKFSFSIVFETVEILDERYGNGERLSEKLQRPTFKGDILVCEDNAINQQVIQGHLSRLGFNVIIVENGKFGVDAVKNRKGKPFDLIFMDIHMPVMDGLEASKKIMELGNKSPIIALTANAMSKDKDTYLRSGMSDFLAKPFVARDLWECLLKYLTPVEMADMRSSGVPETNTVNSVINRQAGIEQSGEDPELYNQLLMRFLKQNKFIFNQISDAVKSGDIKLAYRLTHTLKGTAGTLGAAGLEEAALSVENSLSGATPSVSPEQMRELENRLKDVFDELEPAADEEGQSHETGILDKEKALELIDELCPMLKSGNMQSLDLLPGLKAVLARDKLTGRLIKQMEDCDFEPALETAGQIRQLLNKI